MSTFGKYEAVYCSSFKIKVDIQQNYDIYFKYHDGMSIMKLVGHVKVKITLSLYTGSWKQNRANDFIIELPSDRLPKYRRMAQKDMCFFYMVMV